MGMSFREFIPDGRYNKCGHDDNRALVEPAYHMTAAESYIWVSHNHSMLLVGYDKNYCYPNDPITGATEKYSKSASVAAFVGNGSQAVIIEMKYGVSERQFVPHLISMCNENSKKKEVLQGGIGIIGKRQVVRL